MGRGRRAQRGFTIVELVATLALGSMVSTALFGSMLLQQQLLARQLDDAEAQQRGRVALELMRRFFLAGGGDLGGGDVGSDGVRVVRLEEAADGSLRRVATSFSIDRADPQHPALVMRRTDDEVAFVVAYDIEDLEVRYGLDVDGLQEIDLWCDELAPRACPTGLASALENAQRVRMVDIALATREDHRVHRAFVALRNAR